MVLNQKINTEKIDYELSAEKNIAKGQFGYGIMWLFLALLIEILLYLESLKESYFHIVAFVFLIAAVYKFVIAVKKYRNLSDEKS